MKIWDISRTLSENLASWPGDTPFHFELAAKIGENAVVNVGAIRSSVHNGSHADARFHFEQNGWTIDQAPLEIYFGDVTVVDLGAVLRAGGREGITIAHLAGLETELTRSGRVLIKTGIWPDSSVFPKQIPIIAPDLPEWLQARGIRLIGLDLPSVDPIEAKILQNHHALARCGIAIVESLDLTSVESGSYKLAALPLKIAGGDAAPVRAILWRDQNPSHK